MRRTGGRRRRGRGGRGVRGRVPAAVAGTLAVAATLVALVLSARSVPGCDNVPAVRLSSHC
ncbi:hypothetical protein [Streptomyces camponoticapitis]|uniref:hypothetical protein n=1 Tax=Streptomyces camponoticapitis TaxID=1616125 RepID=UPI00166D4F73|nr:hypothetical protein [Streptomyces camponoticapitis]